MKSDPLDTVFHALASEPRRRVLDVLKQEPGCNVNRVCDFFPDMGRIAVLKHLAVLEEAGLIISEKNGRERLLWFNPTPIQLIHERWTTELSAFWASQLVHLKVNAEGGEVIPLKQQRRKRD